MDKLVQGLVRAVPRERAARVLQADPLLEDADRRLRQRPEGLHGLHEVAAGLDPAQGLSAGQHRSAPPIRRRALAPPLAEGARRSSRRPSLAFLVVYIAALVALFVSAFWTVDPFTSRARPQLDARQLPRRSGTTRPTGTSRCGRSRSPRAVTIDRRADRVPVRVLHGAGRVARVRVRSLFVLVLLPLWASYLARVYAWRLILNNDGLLNWSLQQARPAGREHRVHEHRGLARVLLHLAAVHDPAGLRGARADPPLLHRGLARPRRQGLPHAAHGDPAARAARASSPARSSRSR